MVRNNRRLLIPAPFNPSAFQPAGPIVDKGNDGKRASIIVAAVVGVAVAIVLVTFGALHLFGGTNYGESYRLVNRLNDQLEELWGSRTASCAAMVNKENDYNTDSTTYARYVDECRQGLGDVRETIGELGKSSGITHDEKLKQQFADFEKAANAALPTKSNLDKMAKIFTAVHNFAIRLDEIDGESSEADVRSTAAILTNSGSKDWAAYGQEWETKMLQYLRAYQAYDQISYSDSRYSEVRQSYLDAREAVQDHLRNIEAEDWDNGGLNASAFDTLEDTFDDLRVAIRETYEKHYDGKNEKDCVDFGDGEASCK